MPVNTIQVSNEAGFCLVNMLGTHQSLLLSHGNGTVVSQSLLSRSTPQLWMWVIVLCLTYLYRLSLQANSSTCDVGWFSIVNRIERSTTSSTSHKKLTSEKIWSKEIAWVVRQTVTGMSWYFQRQESTTLTYLLTPWHIGPGNLAVLVLQTIHAFHAIRFVQHRLWWSKAISDPVLCSQMIIDRSTFQWVREMVQGCHHLLPSIQPTRFLVLSVVQLEQAEKKLQMVQEKVDGACFANKTFKEKFEIWWKLMRLAGSGWDDIQAKLPQSSTLASISNNKAITYLHGNEMIDCWSNSWSRRVDAAHFPADRGRAFRLLR